MLRFLFNFILFFFTLGLLFLAVLFWYLIPKLPDINHLEVVKLQIPLRIYTQDGSLIAEFGEKKRQPIRIEDVPTTIIQAFIAAEDSRFYQHPGVDWKSIARATINHLKTGSKAQGGSTITMQVARNFFLSREKTYTRKLNEIFLALKIENKLSKDKILELYLNKIYLGHRSYGIAAAAQTYYGVTIDELTLPQIATLAALPKAPSNNNPISNPRKSKDRRNYILRRMLEENFITEKNYRQAIDTPISATLHSAQIEIEADYIAEMVRKEILEKYGNNSYTGGFKVTATIQDKHQISANQVLRETLSEYDVRHGYYGPKHQYNIDDKSSKAEWEQLLKSFHTVGHLYPALVIKINEQSIIAYSSGIGLIEINWNGLSWARSYINENHRGPAPNTASDILKIGSIIRIRENVQGEWELAQIPLAQAAFISMNPNNGAVLALVGGFDFQHSKFNRATQSKRQVGSGFKPFIYSAGLEAGKTAATLINDAPIIFDNPNAIGNWQPENYSRKNYGPTRLREALIHSRNLVSIRLLNEIGIPTALEHIEKFGFNIDTLPKNLSLSLGSLSASPWEMATAYSTFANSGYKVEPHFIKTIETFEGKIIYQANPDVVCHTCTQKSEILDGTVTDDILLDDTLTDNTLTDDILADDAVTGDNLTDDTLTSHKPLDKQSNKPKIAKRVIDPRNAWIMNSITQDVIKYGTGRRALSLNRSDISGKTGTTNNQRDAWFSGYNADIVAIVWVGFDKFEPLGKSENGARTALPMWIKYMQTVLKNTPIKTRLIPPGLIHSRINKKTGQLTHAGDPDTMFEIFRNEYAPTTTQNNSWGHSPNNSLNDPQNIDIF